MGNVYALFRGLRLTRKVHMSYNPPTHLPYHVPHTCIGQTTADHSFEEADKCQQAFHLLWDRTEAELRARGAMPDKAPNGRLLVNMYNSQNDHAAVELKRVDCIELAIRALLNDDTFEMNRASCGHHKIGLIAEACQRVDSKIGESAFGVVTDKNIREFRTKNPIDMFQRQLSLLFGMYLCECVYYVRYVLICFVC